MGDAVNVICMKWGALYGPHYVNRLHAMVARHMARPHRFVCLTDDATGLAPGIEALPIPPMRIDPPYENTPWRKLALYAPRIGDLSGTALFLDLDVVIVGALDPLVEGPPGWRSIRNWTTPRERTANTSVIRFEIGAHADALDRFHAEPTQTWVDRYRIEQRFLSRELPAIDFFPDPWCVSFKESLLPGGARFPLILLNRVLPARRPGPDARVVVFHGHPNPDEAMEGRWPGAWYKGLRPADWIGEHWRE
ncbi:MAG: glycosyl transferase [Rubrimonas sp.]